MCTIAQDRDTPCWLAGLPERKQGGGGARVCERAHGGPPDGHFGAHVQQHVGAGGSAGGVSGRRVVKEERYKERKGEDESGAQSRSGSN